MSVGSKHTLEMLRTACKAMGRVISPGSKGLRLQTYDVCGKWGVSLRSSTREIAHGGGASERDALYELLVYLCQILSD